MLKYRLLIVLTGVSLAFLITLAVLWAYTAQRRVWVLYRYQFSGSGPTREVVGLVSIVEGLAPGKSAIGIVYRNRDGKVQTLLAMPYVGLAAIACICPLVLGAERYKRRLAARMAGGLCPHCGYDVRATPERCPECGKSPTASPLARR